MSRACPVYRVRQAGAEDVPGMIAMCEAIYPETPPWTRDQLALHQRIFPEGQLVAVADGTNEVMGSASSLVVAWDDYEMNTSWRDFTSRGTFVNHDPAGRTLYGADVMVHPAWQGCGVGKRLYEGRRDLVRRLGLRRIRAGARLRGYHRYAETHTPEQYAAEVVAGRIGDPTLSFQIKQGFSVLAVVRGYLRFDPESLGNAAVIEWVNPEWVEPGADAASSAPAAQRSPR